MTTLIFFHGWGAAGAVWAGQVAAFGQRLTVLTPTIPVWEVDWFTRFLGEMDLRQCVLVGWSLGGMLLLQALSGMAGPPPAGLVLVGVAPVFTRRPDYPWGQPPAMVRAMRRGLQAKPQQVLHDFADQCLAPAEQAFSVQARQAFAVPAAPASLAAGLDYLLAADLRPLLPGIGPGAVIIQGDDDRIVSAAQGRVLRDRLPGARLHPLPGAGHLPFLTQAPVFNRIVEECWNTMR